MNKNTIMMIVMVVLVLISIVQAFELSSLKRNVANAEGLKISSSSGKVATQSGDSGSGNTLPTNVGNLPQMVGGC